MHKFYSLLIYSFIANLFQKHVILSFRSSLRYKSNMIIVLLPSYTLIILIFWHKRVKSESSLWIYTIIVFNNVNKVGLGGLFVCFPPLSLQVHKYQLPFLDGRSKQKLTFICLWWNPNLFSWDYTEPFFMFKFKLLLPAFIIYYITTLNLIRYTAATSVKSLCSALTIILHVFTIFSSIL